MKEGYWGNYGEDLLLPIHEHEMWMRTPGNAEKVGVPVRAICEALRRYKPVIDRDAFLRYLMRKAPVVRIRGHGEMVTFEFDATKDAIPLAFIRKAGAQWFGPHTLVNMFNFATGHSVRLRWQDMCQGGKEVPHDRD